MNQRNNEIKTEQERTSKNVICIVLQSREIIAVDTRHCWNGIEVNEKRSHQKKIVIKNSDKFLTFLLLFDTISNDNDDDDYVGRNTN